MSIGANGGVLGSAAGAPLSQARGDAERNAVDGAGRDRQADAARQTEKSSGIGQTEQDQGASDRDANGQRMWEEQASSAEDENNAGAPSPTQQQPASKDPTGVSGTQLDLMG